MRKQSMERSYNLSKGTPYSKDKARIQTQTPEPEMYVFPIALCRVESLAYIRVPITQQIIVG